jgi:6,7-dimethyl-8-ribityllumazine synthase
MSSQLKNLSDYDFESIKNGKEYQIAIITAEWNPEITFSLHKAAANTLLKHGVLEENIAEYFVPGTFELPAAAKMVAESKNYDAIICLGCVIQGETKHFDFICDSVANGLVNLGILYGKPFIFGVLTPNTLQQAQDRAGGIHGNKGDEAAVTALKMIELSKQLNKKPIIKGFGND